jgi:hypothetical protein
MPRRGGPDRSSPDRDCPGSPPDRGMSRRCNRRCVGGSGACEGFSEIVDGASQRADLVGQPFCLALLCCEQALDTLHLLLEGLQLIDLFLLRLRHRFGFVGQLLGSLGGAGPDLPGSYRAIGFGIAAGGRAPQRYRSGPDQQNHQHASRQHNRLRADTRDAVFLCIVGGSVDHRTPEARSAAKVPHSVSNNTLGLIPPVLARLFDR